MIFLQPHSGLANRIRVIVSGISLAKKLNQPIVLIWRKDAGCNIEFYELFEPIKGLIVKEYSLKFFIMNMIRGKKYFTWIPRLIGIDFYMFDENFKEFVWNNNRYKLDACLLKKSIKNIYINACHDFCDGNDEFAQFVPADRIKALILENTKYFTLKTVGIHIRRADNNQSIKNSPTELFVDQIQKDIDEDNDVNFFLATDDTATEQFLKNQFPGKIFSAKKQYNRNSREGMTGAMVDLYCLSKSAKIYGSYWSSFSDVAAQIGGISLEVMKGN